MPETVLADAQFSIARILRPYTNFETQYQGQPVDRRIMLSEVVNGPGGEARDDLAIKGQTGIDPELARGLAVPMGARVLIWFPKILPDNTLSEERDIRYNTEKAFVDKLVKKFYEHKVQVE